MKEILTNIIIMLYFCTSLFTLYLAITYPFVMNMKDNPIWLKWYYIYPLTLLICASQRQCLELIDKYKS